MSNFSSAERKLSGDFVDEDKADHKGKHNDDSSYYISLPFSTNREPCSACSITGRER